MPYTDWVGNCPVGNCTVTPLLQGMQQRCYEAVIKDIFTRFFTG